MIDLKRPDIMKPGDIVLEFLAVSNPEESPEIQKSLQLHIEKGFTPFGFSRHPHYVQYLLIPTYTLPIREVKQSTINLVKLLKKA